MKYRGIPISDIVLHKHPLVYFLLVKDLLIDLLFWLKGFFIRRFFYILAFVTCYALIAHIDSLHVNAFVLCQSIKMFLWFAGYWIILGVASSIGLGTGLHTFVLYLGPHIAKVAMVATNCGHIPQMIPSRWQFDHFGQCQQTTGETITFFGILLAVQVESFLWGLGTALGQLPPYFVAKKAADTNEELMKMELEAEKDQEERKKLLKQADEIDEIHVLKRKENKSLMDKAKIVIFDNLQRYGFITILLCASIPNPLFDLAGITCGHFRISFRKFFTATFIGKAIIKVHIQMLFVITMFRKETLQSLHQLIGLVSEGLATFVEESLKAQREVLHHPSTFQDNKPLVARLWDVFIILMVGYFLLSIVNSEVQEKAVKNKDK